MSVRLLPLLFWFACRHPAPPEVLVDPVGEAPARALWAVGDWSGSLALSGGVSLRLVVHVTEADGGLAATLDSPDQGALGLPVERASVEGDTLILEVTAIGGRFEGTREGERIVGTWSQGPSGLPLTLTRGAVDAPVARPQEPRPPFPYLIEEVEIPSVDGVILSGTWSRPDGDGPFPGVVLISGSGPQDRDESLLGHKPFAVLADALTRAGIAVLRTDDRGVGRSTGDFASARTPDFAEDAARTLAWVDARAETGDVGWIGHSEGGLIAPLAQVREGGIRADFLVLLAGPAVSGREVLIAQGAAIAAAEGADDATVAEQRAMSEALLAAVVAGDDRAALVAALRASPAAATLSDAQVESAIDDVLSPWFRWFLAHDPGPVLTRVDVPVLALFGERDLQVLPEQNVEPMRRALGARGTVEVLPGLNHLFQPATTGAPSEYARIPVTFDPAALERVAGWILEVARR